MKNAPATMPVPRTSATCAIQMIKAASIIVSTHSRHDIKTRHHGPIFMLQVVAMKHVASAKLFKTNHHQHLFARVECDRVLPTALVQERRLAVSLQNLEMAEMNMRGVRPAQK